MVAKTSDHNGLYVFEDNVIFKVVDEQNRLVPSGMYGDKVLITILFNRTQPVRYELSDSMRLAADTGGSSLPFARVDGIQGRIEDILHLPGYPARRWPCIRFFYHVLDSLPVNGWQVIQESDGLRVLLSGARNDVNDSMLVEEIRAI